MEFLFNDCITAESEVIGITAGTMVVVPSYMALDAELAGYPEGWEDWKEEDHPPLPDYLLVCAGQTLSRESYPGWNSEYQGGFYDFTLPNLVNKFIVGFDADGKAIMGTGCIYFRDHPERAAPMPRDVRQM